VNEPTLLELTSHGRTAKPPPTGVSEFTLLFTDHTHDAEAVAHGAAAKDSGHEGAEEAGQTAAAEEGAAEPAGGEEHSSEEHHDPQGAHDEHHMKASDIGTTTAVMLLGFVAFVMALFYLINWHDMDIRLYTWTIISATVSIFCAVLLFSAIAETFTWVLWDSTLVHFGLFLVLWIVTQFLLLYFKDDNAARLRGEAAEIDSARISEDKDGSRSEEEGKQLIKAPSNKVDPEGHDPKSLAVEELPNIPLKAFGTIFAHITGFAAIKCFGTAQVNPKFLFGFSWLLPGWLVIGIFALVSFALGILSLKVRVWWVHRQGQKKEGVKHEQWREQCRESEDDAVGLCLSSLVCAVSRFTITGEVPQAHGSIHGRTPLQVFTLFGVGAVFVVLVAAATFKYNKMRHSREAEAFDHAEDTGKMFEPVRFMRIVQVFCGLTMSWCFYFATQWAFYQFLQHKQSLQGVAGKLMMAVMVSFCSMVVIFVLDCLGDGSNSCKKAIEGVIVALGLLVGISWEGTFGHAVTEIGLGFSTDNAVLVKNLLAISLVVVVVPAWRLYIVPRTEPEVMAYFGGKLPPLSALCHAWDPDKDYKPSKTEQFSSKRKAGHMKHAGDMVVAVIRATSNTSKPPTVEPTV